MYYRYFTHATAKSGSSELLINNLVDRKTKRARLSMVSARQSRVLSTYRARWNMK